MLQPVFSRLQNKFKNNLYRPLQPQGPTRNTFYPIFTENPLFSPISRTVSMSHIWSSDRITKSIFSVCEQEPVPPKTRIGISCSFTIKKNELEEDPEILALRKSLFPHEKSKSPERPLGNSFFQNREGFSEQRQSNVIYREKTAKGAATQEIGRVRNSWNQSFGNFVTPNPDNMRTSRGGGVQRRRGRYGRWQGYYRCFDCKLTFFAL